MLQEMFHFEEDSRGIIKRIIFKMLGRTWKETRNRLYHQCYDPQLSLEENIENRPDGITADYWRWFLDYRNSEETQLYIHTGGSKSLARLGEEENVFELSLPLLIHFVIIIGTFGMTRRSISRGELYLLTHKRANGSYVHDAARAIGDSLAQALGKEHPGRVRGMGLGPTSNQVFGMNSHQPSNGFEREETQRVLLELQPELAAEKLKRKAVNDEVAVEKTKRQAVEDKVVVGKVRMQAMESALICLLQGQSRKLPSDVTAWMSALEGQNRKLGDSSGFKPPPVTFQKTLAVKQQRFQTAAAISNRRTFRVDHCCLDRGGFKPPLNIATLILGFAAVVPAVPENRRKSYNYLLIGDA
ncbi:hypothetical protein Ahy_B08g089466 [Arachis hypogaea]|uniref:Uncharacterized protein n=1 Tax=Arachis hypogaea TaxID=3818 RepID=A0A444XXX3_ARAHY|nr:hypothetical protein Ahy_B08g089466 [Arachis hypogaea]